MHEIPSRKVRYHYFNNYNHPTKLNTTIITVILPS